MLRLSISFGGSKVRLALVNPMDFSILCSTDRIEWSSDSRWNSQDSLNSLMHLIAIYTSELIQSIEEDISVVEQVGVAWPGPGIYRDGILAATFIPGCHDTCDIRGFLLRHLQKVFPHISKDLPIFFALDVNARARGLLKINNDLFFQKDGLVLNIATGIAGALIRDNKVISNDTALGPNYGQWGRFLFKNIQTKGWFWRPTKDGSIPEYDHETEVRFTDLCGGPAIVRRFNTFFSTSYDLLPPSIQKIFKDYRGALEYKKRNVEKEKTLLMALSKVVYESSAIREFVDEVICDIGQAILLLKKTFFAKDSSMHCVLTGGVGDFFVYPGQDNRSDVLLCALNDQLRGQQITVIRSNDGLDAELLGCALLE